MNRKQLHTNEEDKKDREESEINVNRSRCMMDRISYQDDWLITTKVVTLKQAVVKTVTLVHVQY